mmetsp:Transcript_5730/g.7722  ORF Transcript_5730/g.7722 Transcript_5730/m.7722 type:complete len:212 (+) Transcript_5730:47-682(+)
MNETKKRNSLTEDSLVFALGTVVPRKALTDTRRIVASSTTRAVTSLCITISFKHIRSRGALHQRAIRATAAKITHASHMLGGIPRSRVDTRSLNSKLILSEANTGIRAGVGADSSLAGNSLIVGEACALSSGAITVTLVGALNNGVEVIGRLDVSHPGHGLGASALRAISSCPGGLAVLAIVASALVVDPARPVTTAPVRAVSNRNSCKGS